MSDECRTVTRERLALVLRYAAGLRSTANDPASFRRALASKPA